MPHEGILASATQEFAGLGGTSDFYKLTAKAKWYYTVNDDADIIASLGGSAGSYVQHGRSDGSLRPVPSWARTTSVVSSVTALVRAAENMATLSAGTTYFTASAEATFPLPFVSRDAGFRGAIFADAGTLYGNEVRTTADDELEGTNSSLRASVGLGIIWASPFGPLRVDYAIPVAKEDFDRVQNLKFGISSSF